MGNCFTNDDEKITQPSKNITTEEVTFRINKMREYWKIRADRKSNQNMSLILKKDTLHSDINIDENNISRDHSKYSFSTNI
jgi:hypothetical protein